MLEVADAVGTSILVDAVAVPPQGVFAVSSLPPGEYEYSAVTASDTTAGAFLVESYTDEMLLRPVDAADLAVAGPDETRLEAGRRPLRTSPFVYLLILAALCAEWAGRRRAGLR